MKIYVIRHGESEYNREGKIQGHTDIPLSQTGHEQASAIAGCLKEVLDEEPILAVYSSDLLRARQTAEHLVKALENAGRRVPFHQSKDLREVKLGVFEGRTRRELLAEKEADGVSLFRKWLDNPKDVVPENAESMPDFFERVKKFLFQLADTTGEKDGNVVIFTHGGVISMIQNFVHGRTPSDFLKYAIGNASGVILEYRNGRFEETGTLACPIEFQVQSSERL